MKKLSLIFACLMAIPAAAITASCADDVEEAFNCQQICQRYDDCVDDDYDVTACIDRCEENADADEDFAERADACEACLDDRSCGESFPCVDECIGVVP